MNSNKSERKSVRGLAGMNTQMRRINNYSNCFIDYPLEVLKFIVVRYKPTVMTDSIIYKVFSPASEDIGQLSFMLPPRPISRMPMGPDFFLIRIHEHDSMLIKV